MITKGFYKKKININNYFNNLEIIQLYKNLKFKIKKKIKNIRINLIIYQKKKKMIEWLAASQH